ncbi:MAG: hypothetical protein AMR96_02995 [Candidatus Adiutrix intracellularis]|nr:MAG: hypothetical protein AMR96_02995 [Candidatus Adiutrix intracellularis]MDR2827333.1 hypothetical protein [Candidatus Adiutrix intracellularis]
MTLKKNSALSRPGGSLQPVIFALNTQCNPSNILKRANPISIHGYLMKNTGWYRDILILTPLLMATYNNLSRAYSAWAHRKG